MSILFCKISLLDSTEKGRYHTWKWLLSARLSPSEREQHFRILKYKRWVKNCLVTLEEARVRHAKQPWKDVSGRAWGSRSTILNYCFPLLAFGHFKMAGGLSSNTAICGLIHPSPQNHSDHPSPCQPLFPKLWPRLCSGSISSLLFHACIRWFRCFTLWGWV